MGTTITDLNTSRVINSTWRSLPYNKNSVMVALLVGSLATVALASTRYDGSHSGGFGGAGGFGGVGGVGGVGSFGGVGGVGVGHGNCRNWCKGPPGQYQCCDDIKLGTCPPVRPQCPPVRNFRPPP